MVPAEIQKYYLFILNEKYYNLDNKEIEIESVILNIAHNLDLIRCNNDKKLKEEVLDDPRLNKIISKNDTQLLLDYAHELIVATGNKVSSHQEHKPYDLNLFYLCSTSPKQCLEKIISIEQPQFEVTQSKHSTNRHP